MFMSFLLLLFSTSSPFCSVQGTGQANGLHEIEPAEPCLKIFKLPESAKATEQSEKQAISTEQNFQQSYASSETEKFPPQPDDSANAHWLALCDFQANKPGFHPTKFCRLECVERQFPKICARYLCMLAMYALRSLKREECFAWFESWQSWQNSKSLCC